jgi:RNA polymerase sigma-B factor
MVAAQSRALPTAPGAHVSIDTMTGPGPGGRPALSAPTRVAPARIESMIPATTEQLLRRRDALPPDDPGRTDLRAWVIEQHLPMARQLARRYAARGASFDDLAQVAALALVKAVDGYDSRRENLFVSYAIPSILGALKRHFRDTAWGMRVPRAMQELVLLIWSRSGELAHRLGRRPTSVELAAHLDITLDDLADADAAIRAYRPASLEASGSSMDGGGRAEFLRDLRATDPPFAGVDNELLMRTLMAALPERGRRIVMMRFYQDMTQTEIAAVIGLSQAQISRLLRQSLAQMHVAITAPASKAPAVKSQPSSARSATQSAGPSGN